MIQTATFESLRDLVLHHAARRGWATQRQVAVMCGLDESALSRFLNGEQDLGARRTHTLFQAVGVPVEEYDLAYALLGHAQDGARAVRIGRRGPTGATATITRSVSAGWERQGSALPELSVDARATGDLPATVVVALFAARGYSGEQIAAFFAGSPAIEATHGG